MRYLAEEAVSIDQLLVVTFTRAAASELRDRIRSSLRLAADHLGGAPLPPDDVWMSALTRPDGRGEDRRAERLARLRRAVNRFDEATISTIHGFGQQALAQFGVRCGVEPGATLVERDRELVLEVCRDHLIGHLVDDPLAMSPPTANGDAHARPTPSNATSPPRSAQSSPTPARRASRRRGSPGWRGSGRRSSARPRPRSSGDGGRVTRCRTTSSSATCTGRSPTSRADRRSPPSSPSASRSSWSTSSRTPTDCSGRCSTGPSGPGV